MGEPQLDPVTLSFNQNPQACLPTSQSLFRRPAGGPPSPWCWSGLYSSVLLPAALLPHHCSSSQVLNIPRTFLVQRFMGWKGRGGERLLNTHWQRRKRLLVKVTSVAIEFPDPSCFFSLNGESACLYLTGQLPRNSVPGSHSRSPSSLWLMPGGPLLSCLFI